MKKQTKERKTTPAIKGYLPLRVALPPIDGGKEDRPPASFLYVKEHAQRAPGPSGAGATLFVANAPAGGPVRTDVFLRALFERHGEVQRVTVARDPRRVGSAPAVGKAAEAFREAALLGTEGGLFSARGDGSGRGDGKFAHVVFASSKEMKKALKAIRKETSEADDRFAIRFDRARMEQLKKETSRLIASEKRGPDNEDDDDETEAPLTGIHAMAARARRKAYRHVSRAKLLEMCNDAMSSFEAAEAEAERRAKLAAEQPDEDGFITVVRGSAPSFGAANDLEEGHGRRRGAKRGRKRKGAGGAGEHADFYRFQRKEVREREASLLRRRFEEDLREVERRRGERAYRPF